MFSTFEDTLQFLSLSSKRYLHPNRRKNVYQEFNDKLFVLEDFRKDSLEYFSPLSEDNNDLIISTIYQKTETEVIQHYSDSYEEPEEYSIQLDKKEDPFVEVSLIPDISTEQCTKLLTSEQKSKNVFRSKSLNQERNTNVYFLYTSGNQNSKKRQRICSTESKRFCNEKILNFDRLPDYFDMESNRKKKLKYTFMDDDSINEDTSPSDCENSYDREECPKQDLSKIRITGRLGITNDDKYVVQCKAVVNDSEVPVNVDNNELYSSDWNYKSDKSIQTKSTRSKTEEVNPSYHDYAHRYSDVSDFSKHLNNGFSKPNTFQVSDNPLVIISVYSPQPIRKELSNQRFVQKRNSTDADKTVNYKYDVDRHNSGSSKDMKQNIQNGVKCCRCCCASDDNIGFPSNKYRSHSLSNDQKRLIEIITNNGNLENNNNTESIDFDRLDNEISPSLTNRASSSFTLHQQLSNKVCPCPPQSLNSPPKPKRSASPQKNPKNNIKKKVSKKELFKSTKVIQRVDAETSPLRKPIKNKSPLRNASPTKKDKKLNKLKDERKNEKEDANAITQDINSNSKMKNRSKSPNRKYKNKKGKKENKPVKESSKADNRESSIHVNIEGLCENYDLSFHQGPEVANVMIMKQIKNGLSNIKNKCLNSRSRGSNFQNQYPSMMDRTCVTSEHLTKPFSMPKSNICSGRNCPARKFLDQNSSKQSRRKFEPDPRCSEENSIEDKKIDRRRSDGKNTNKQCQDAKHYTGDGCLDVDPVDRDRQIRKLLGVGTPRSSASNEYQEPPTLCSMDCLYRQCNTPKSSYSYTNAIMKTRHVKAVPIQIMIERGTGSSIIDENDNAEETISKQSIEIIESSENEEESVDIAKTSLYKQLVLDRNAVDELFEIKPSEIIKHQLSSISIGEVRKRIKYQKSTHTASKEVQADPSEHFFHKSVTSSEIVVPIKLLLHKSTEHPKSDLESSTQTSIISHIPKYDCRSIQTIFYAKAKSITPNLGPSQVSLLQQEETYNDNEICSTQLKPQPKSKKLFNRLIPCFVFHNVRSSNVRLRGNANDICDKNTINSYSISTSPIMGMSSSMFDTSVSYYSNHSICNNLNNYKSKRGFFSSVKDFLSIRKKCDRDFS